MDGLGGMRKRWIDHIVLILQCYIFEILKVFKDEIIIIFLKIMTKNREMLKDEMARVKLEEYSRCFIST